MKWVANIDRTYIQMHAKHVGKRPAVRAFTCKWISIIRARNRRRQSRSKKTPDYAANCGRIDCWRWRIKGLSWIQVLIYRSQAVLRPGTSSRGQIIIVGNWNIHRVPITHKSSIKLSENLLELGLLNWRFKNRDSATTRSSIDYKTEIQPGTLRQTYLVSPKDEDYRYDQILAG